MRNGIVDSTVVRESYERMGLADGITQTSVTHKTSYAAGIGQYECACITRQEYDRDPIYSFDSDLYRIYPTIKEYHTMILKTEEWIITYSLNAYVKYNSSGSFVLDPYIINIYKNELHDDIYRYVNWTRVFNILITEHITDRDINTMEHFVKEDYGRGGHIPIKLMRSYLNSYAVIVECTLSGYDRKFFKLTQDQRKEVIDLVARLNKHNIFVPVWRMAGQYSINANRRTDFKDGWRLYSITDQECTLMVKKIFKIDGDDKTIYVPSTQKFIYNP